MWRNIKLSIPKFRVWDKANKAWATDFTISLDGGLLCDNGSTLFIKENFEIMLWSGLEDYSGTEEKDYEDCKEIYEGDIIRLVFGDNSTFYTDQGIWETLLICKLDFGVFGFVDPKDDNSYFSYQTVHDENHCIYVVGNIYENPGLLEKNE